MHITKKSRRGAAGSQYALIVGLIAVVALVAIGNLGGGVRTLLLKIGNHLLVASNGAVITAPLGWQTGSDLGGIANGVPVSGLNLNAGGGSAAITYSLISGALPTGLTLSSSGVISGTPTVNGSYNFTVRASSGSETADQSFVLRVGIMPNCAASSAIGNPFTNTAIGSVVLATVSSGTISTATVTAGALPAGLSLSLVTASGTPTTAGPYNFTLQVTSSTNITANCSFSGSISGRMIFSYTGTNQSFVVPAGVTSIDSRLWGGAGGSDIQFSASLPNYGGGGGFARGVLNVTPGETLNVIVGGGGQASKYTATTSHLRSVGGFGGGGDSNTQLLAGTPSGSGNVASMGAGGGRSAIQRSSADIITAGGGGGGAMNAFGGPGGGTTGGNGAYTSNPGGFGACENGDEGLGGTQSAGGGISTAHHSGGFASGCGTMN